MSSEMVERVARFMYSAMSTVSSCAWDDLPDELSEVHCKNDYLDMALAAIAAMRGPTKQMLHASTHCPLWGSEEMQNGQRWQAMIDAALTEEAQS